MSKSDEIYNQEKNEKDKTTLIASLSVITAVLIATVLYVKKKYISEWGQSKWGAIGQFIVDIFLKIKSYFTDWKNWLKGDILETSETVKESKILTFFNQFFNFGFKDIDENFRSKHRLSSIIFMLTIIVGSILAFLFFTAIDSPFKKGTMIGLIICSIISALFGAFFYIRNKNKRDFFENKTTWLQLKYLLSVVKKNAIYIASVSAVLLFLIIGAGVLFQSERSTIMVLSALGPIVGVILMFALYAYIANSSWMDKIKRFRPLLILFYLIFIIPCLISLSAGWLSEQFRNTPGFVYTILLVEIVIIVLYFLIPMVDRTFIFSLTNKKTNADDLNEIMKLNKERKERLENQIFKLKKNIFKLSYSENVINMNKIGVEETWNGMVTLSDEALETRLIELKFCDENENTDTCRNKRLKKIVKAIRKAVGEINNKEQEIASLKTEISPEEALVDLNTDEESEENAIKDVKDAIILQMTPVSLKEATTPISPNKSINIYKNIANQTNYAYALSFWIFIHPQSGSIKQCNNIINFDGRPQVMYCPTYNKIPDGDIVKYMKFNDSKNLIKARVVNSKTIKNEYVIYTLEDVHNKDANGNNILYKNVHHSKIKYNYPYSVLKFLLGSSKETQQEYTLPNLKLQRWNNIVINYIDGVYDLFVNGELVNSFQNGMDDFKYDNITIGEEKGISGGIANVIYYKNYLTKHKISANYNLLKNKSPPIVSTRIKL